MVLFEMFAPGQGRAPLHTVGFTGTGHGMTHPQAASVQRLVQLALYRGATVAHHGSCVGADTEFHHAAAAIGMLTHGHPASDVADYKVARLRCTYRDAPLPALRRNRVIVRHSDELIAAPEQDHEVVRSGTWATIRYARLSSTTINIVWPDGSVSREEF